MPEALIPPVPECQKFRILHSSSLNDMGLLQLFQGFVAKRKGAKSCWVQLRKEDELLEG